MPMHAQEHDWTLEAAKLFRAKIPVSADQLGKLFSYSDSKIEKYEKGTPGERKLATEFQTVKKEFIQEIAALIGASEAEFKVEEETVQEIWFDRFLPTLVKVIDEKEITQLYGECQHYRAAQHTPENDNKAREAYSRFETALFRKISQELGINEQQARATHKPGIGTYAALTIAAMLALIFGIALLVQHAKVSEAEQAIAEKASLEKQRDQAVADKSSAEQARNDALEAVQRAEAKSAKLAQPTKNAAGKLCYSGVVSNGKTVIDGSSIAEVNVFCPPEKRSYAISDKGAVDGGRLYVGRCGEPVQLMQEQATLGKKSKRVARK